MIWLVSFDGLMLYGSCRARRRHREGLPIFVVVEGANACLLHGNVPVLSGTRSFLAASPESSAETSMAWLRLQESSPALSTPAACNQVFFRDKQT